MSDHDPPANDADAMPADPEELDFTDDENVVEIGEGRYVVGTNGRPNVRRSRGQRREPPADDSGFTAADPANPDERRPAGDDPRASAAGPGVGERGQQGGGPAGGGGQPGGGQQPGGERSAGQPPDGGQPPPNAAQGRRRNQSAAASGDTVDRQAVSRWLANSFDGDGFDYGIDATLHANGDTTRQRMVSNDVTATFDTLITWFASNAGPSSPTPETIGLLLAASETTVDLPPVMIKRFAASQGLSASDSIGDLVRAAEDAGGFRIE
ncbi:hypothetical protein C463_03172 [Halorubrum californiense DSM 19288]|uniref:Flagella cluster protein n=1 Tax=Halorubrum californiense DSM 19288 TaxID=1227465 RepID=M0EJ18_9EURY|nr:MULTISPECIES: hypothetical protein [Halorubrum]ELZ47033.1 hypothetical protein C463_03172 [Halorubrum californiense DSM 19288]TKX65663.1 hypothetical protein EXE40_16640 [Halorubrum sp. GN11GM_10-3_MGM]